MRHHTTGYASALFMLALVVSPCYGDIETFLGKPLNGTMVDWKLCQAVSMQTSNDTYYIECKSAPDKCAGEYIMQQETNTEVSNCYGNRLAATIESGSTTGDILRNSVLAVAVLTAFVLLADKYKVGSKLEAWWESRIVSPTIARDVQTIKSSARKITPGYDYSPKMRVLRPASSLDFAFSEKEWKIEQERRAKEALIEDAKKRGANVQELDAIIARDVEKMAPLTPRHIKELPPTAEVIMDTENGVMVEVSILKDDVFLAKKESKDKRRHLLQVEDDHPPADGTNTFVVFNEHVTVPNEEIHKRFAQTILEYTGTPPLDLKLPSAHRNRKMLANDTVDECGYVKISPPVTLGGNFTYAHDACKTTASKNITSYVFLRTIMELDQNGIGKLTPSWLELTKNDPRLGHPADAGKYNDVLSWVNPLEQQVVAYPYTSFGHLLPYAPVMDAGCDQDYEAGNHLQIKAHLNKIAHPELWDVSVGGGGGIFSRETMTTLYEVMSRVRTVTTAAMNGDYLSYSGEFQKSTLRNPQRLCAGAKKAFEWKKGGVPGGNTANATFVKGHNYCGKSAARPAFGIPPTKLLLDTTVHMYAGLSNVKAAIFTEFTSAPGFRTPADWNWLSRLSLEILGGQISALNFGWTPATGQQPEPEY
jgi:hypothetical protein